MEQESRVVEVKRGVCDPKTEDATLNFAFMSDNEAAPVVNKNKRHRKEKRTSVNVSG